MVAVVTAIVLGLVTLVIGHGVCFWVLYKWGGLSANAAVRLGVLLGAVVGFVLACWLVPGGGGMLSFLEGGPAAPGLYYCLAVAALFAVTFIPPGWKASR